MSASKNHIRKRRVTATQRPSHSLMNKRGVSVVTECIAFWCESGRELTIYKTEELHKTAMLIGHSIFSHRKQQSLFLAILMNLRLQFPINHEPFCSIYIVPRFDKYKLWKINVFCEERISCMVDMQEVSMFIQKLLLHSAANKSFPAFLSLLIRLLSDFKRLTMICVEKQRRKHEDEQDALISSTSDKIIDCLQKAYPFSISLTILSKSLGVDAVFAERILSNSLLEELKSNTSIDQCPTIALLVTDYELFMRIIRKLAKKCRRHETGKLGRGCHIFSLINSITILVAKLPLIDSHCRRMSDTASHLLTSILKEQSTIDVLMVADIGPASAYRTRISLIENDTIAISKRIRPGDTLVSHSTNANGFFYANQYRQNELSKWRSPKAYTIIDKISWKITLGYGFEEWSDTSVQRPDEEKLDIIQNNQIYLTRPSPSKPHNHLIPIIDSYTEKHGEFDNSTLLSTLIQIGQKNTLESFIIVRGVVGSLTNTTDWLTYVRENASKTVLGIVNLLENVEHAK